MNIDEKKEHLDALLDKHDIRNFEAWEFCQLTHPDWEGPREALPEKEMLPNIIPAADITQIIRDVLGPLMYTSVYRPPRYNRMLPGASPTSNHKVFKAIDFRPPDYEEVSWSEFVGVSTSVVLTAMHNSILTDGGKIGMFIYPDPDQGLPFIHVDYGAREESIIRRID